MSSHTRVLYFGMPCVFSHAPLAALLASDLEVAGLVVPAPPALRPGASDEPRLLPPPGRSVFMAGQQDTPVLLAWQHGVPVLEVRSLAPAPTLAALAAYQPDVIAVACFPRRLPRAVLDLPRLGCLNVHPSLLPRYRGPAPLFWTFRLGERRTGATVHLMADELDAGDVLRQEALDVPEGIDGLAFEAGCAAVGGRLLVAAIHDLAAGAASRVPQDPAAATYQPWPSPADFAIDRRRPAQWAFNFIRGAAHLGYPLVVPCSGAPQVVEEALGYAPDGTLGQSCERHGDELWVQCTPGILRARIADDPA